MTRHPESYLGVDLVPGSGVDVVCDAEVLCARFGPSAFDLVISTEMIEHVRDWRTTVQNLKAVLRPGGHLLLTTRSPGFPYHGWPTDYWRYEPSDMSKIFRDMDVIALDDDPLEPGVFVFARRPANWVDSTPTLELHSIITGQQRTRTQPYCPRTRFRIRRRLALIRSGVRPSR